MGLGLATSRVLSQKHGGSLELSNIASGGACVTIKLAVHKMNCSFYLLKDLEQKSD